MSRRQPAGRPGDKGSGKRVRAYLRRFFTCWVAEDPEPTYSTLDLEDGLGQVPDPVCQPRAQVPESTEVAGFADRGKPSRATAASGQGGRAGL